MNAVCEAAPVVDGAMCHLWRSQSKQWAASSDFGVSKVVERAPGTISSAVYHLFPLVKKHRYLKCKKLIHAFALKTNLRLLIDLDT